MDYRLRSLLRRYWGSSTPENAKNYLDAMMRAGEIEHPPMTPSIFSDETMPVGGTRWLVGQQNPDFEAWVVEHDQGGDDASYLVPSHYAEDEGTPGEIVALFDQASDEGYHYIRFDAY